MTFSADVCLAFFELGSASQSWRDEGYAGGFVTCFVPTSDLRRAIDMAESALLDDGYEVVSIDKVLRYVPSEWERAEEVKRSVAECLANNDVCYGSFEVWGH